MVGISADRIDRDGICFADRVNAGIPCSTGEPGEILKERVGDER